MTDFSLQFALAAISDEALLKSELNHQAENLRSSSELFSNTVIDSRLCQDGSLFFAFCGDNVDGHDYIETAFSMGARLAVVERFLNIDVPQIKVSSCMHAVASLAGMYRRSWKSTNVIAITGSAGKTSTKDILAYLLGQIDTTQATSGNFNNELGLPLTILNTHKRTKYLILEMGAAQSGDIKYLMDIACPDIGLITNIGDAHIGRFGSLRDIAETKTEIFSCLNEGAIAVINQDDQFSTLFLQVSKHVSNVSFSYQHKNDVYIKSIDSDVINLQVADVVIPLKLPFTAKHQVQNFLSAVGCIYALKVNLQCLQAIQGYKNISPHRQTVISLCDDVDLIDDTYNSSPAAMKSAIDFAVDISNVKRRMVLIFGAMAELGEFSDEKHLEVTEYALTSGFSCFIFCGKASMPAFDFCQDNKISSFYCDDEKTVSDIAVTQIQAGDVVLIKGSRAEKLDTAVEAIVEHQKNNNWGNSACC